MAEKKIKDIMDSINIKPNSIIVYDIDDTLIDRNGNLIIPIVNTFYYASLKGFKIALITARPGQEENIYLSMRQLKSLGLSNYVTIYFRMPEKTDLWRYKTMARKNLFERGYQVEMSIGDMPWDMGDYGGIGVLV